MIAGLSPAGAHIHPRGDRNWRTGMILLKGDQRVTILLPQVEVADKAVVDDLFDHDIGGVRRGRAGLRSDRFDGDGLGPQGYGDGTAERARGRDGSDIPSGNKTRAVSPDTRTTRPSKKFAAPRKLAMKRDTGR